MNTRVHRKALSSSYHAKVIFKQLVPFSVDVIHEITWTIDALNGMHMTIMNRLKKLSFDSRILVDWVHCVQ